VEKLSLLDFFRSFNEENILRSCFSSSLSLLIVLVVDGQGHLIQFISTKRQNMSYMFLLLLLTVGYVLGAPIPTDSLQFSIVECTSNDNDTLSKYVIEVTDINDTCIRINQSSPTGNQISLYVTPQIETGVKIHIITENCSVPLPDLHLSLCDDETNSNDTLEMVTYRYNTSFVDILENDDNSTINSFVYTGPTVFETEHHLDQDDDEEDKTTIGSLINIQSKTTVTDSTSDESEEKDED
jgi:hypothetical protein